MKSAIFPHKIPRRLVLTKYFKLKVFSYFFQENVVNADAVQSVEETIEREAEAEPVIDWKVGDFCRSIYSEDGEEYEGVINISK